jgi:RNA recognition motif-containing protein
MTIYRKASQEDLINFFNGYDKVKRVQLPTDRETGRMRGFAFVDMEEDSQESLVFEALDGNGKPQPTEFIIEGIFEEENDKELVENILIQIASLDQSIYEVQSRTEGLKLDTRNILAELEKI